MSRNFWKLIILAVARLYTEMLGEFIEGWIPDDMYRFEILPRVNPKKLMVLSESKIIDDKLFPSLTIEPLMTRLRGEYIDRNGKIYKAKNDFEKLKQLDHETVIKPANGLWVSAFFSYI